MRSRQINLFKNSRSDYGGDLLKTRNGRLRGRPLATRHTMHLVLRSTKAVGPWSFKRPNNEMKILKIVNKFALKHGVGIQSMSNAGNHLHLQIKLEHRLSYKPFIRAITAAIAMAVTGASRWKPLKKSANDRFWDCRPFTRIAIGRSAFLNLRNYIKLNALESFGYSRKQGRVLITRLKATPINTS